MSTPPSYHDGFSTVHTISQTLSAGIVSISENQSYDDGKLPREMKFNEDSLVSVVAYSTLFVIAALGNLTVFITLFRNRHRKSRVNLFIMHLAIADLIVTFVMLPLETGWHITVSWEAGDVGCRILMFCRAFGFYLSSFILVAISLDRYFAIIHPMSLNEVDHRGKVMLSLAWAFSLISSVPQSVIFHVDRHPKYDWFTQCVTFNFFPTAAHELAYNLFNAITLYGLPLLIIIVTYTLILCEMTRKTKRHREMSLRGCDYNFARGCERRSAIGNIQKARIRTLKMTIVIVNFRFGVTKPSHGQCCLSIFNWLYGRANSRYSVVVFIVCWTPYFFMSAWWWVDRKSAAKINPKVQRGLFIFAVSNSCVDPIVYGMFSIDFMREFRRCCCCFGLPIRSGVMESSQQNIYYRSILVSSTSDSFRDHVISSKREHQVELESFARNEITFSNTTTKTLVEGYPSGTDRSAINDFTRTSTSILSSLKE